MTKRLLIVVVIAGAFALTDIRADQRPADPGKRPAAAKVVAADRHDRSRALRDLPAGMAPAGEKAEGREPRWRRVSRHPQGLLPDPVVQDVPAVPLIPGPVNSFEGVNNVNGALPPDTNGDVGPNHFVQWVNLSFAVYSKGTPTSPPALLYGPASANTLWSGFGGPCESRNDGDPIVRYDHLADRWLMSQLAVPNSFFGLLFGPFYQCIAVSATPDPLGAYNRYQFAFAKLNDYPKLAVWPDGYYMTINQYSAVSLQFAGQGVVAFDRAKMIAGLPATAIYYDLASVDLNLGGMLPADLDGPPPPAGSPAFFVQIDDDAWGAEPADQLQLWKFHTDWTTPSLSSFTRAAELPTAPFDSDMCGYARNCLPQPGTTVKVDAMSDRLMYRLQYRNFGTHESLVVNHTVDAEGSDHAGIRWYEIRDPGSAPSIFQQGTYAPDPDHRWMGSAAMDSAGNIALGFSVSGTVTSPSIRYTGRLAGDPLNTMTLGESDLMVGSGSQTHSSGRWGDYSSLVVDPLDDCTFWYTQEYYAVTSQLGWQTRIGSFALPSCEGASSDLPVAKVIAPATMATEAGPTSVDFTVTRTGDIAQPLTVYYTVSGTAAPGADYVALPGSATIPGGEAAATVSVTPIDDTVFEPNETVVLTLMPDPAYVLGSLSATGTIASDDLPPDLIVTALTGPATAGAGTTVTVTDTTKNQGTGPAPPSATGFYLSINTAVDAADVSLGSRPVSLLAPGASESVTTPLLIPAGTPTGIYFLLAKADAAGAVTEGQETNNTKAGPSLSVGPDLTVTTLTAPLIALAGGVITVSDTTKNGGGGVAGASVTSFYLSTNLIFNATDVLLGGRSVSALEKNATESGSTPLTIPAATPAGLYYVVAKADGTGMVVETQEGNNIRFSVGIRVGPDLIESGVVVQLLTGAGDTFNVPDTVKNQGAAAAAASTTKIYLSVNTVLDGSDVLLASRSVPALVAGGQHAASTPVQIPSATATGVYYVIAKADADDEVAESTETNNTAYGTTRIGPDLVVTALTTPSTAVAGATTTASDTTKNAGGGAAGGTTTRFYLSVNTARDAGDVLIGSRTVGALTPGSIDSGSVALTIPVGTTPGTYFIIAVADADNVVPETTETANTRAIGIKVVAGT